MVSSGLNRHEKLPFELCLVPQKSRIEEFHDRPQVPHVVLHRRSRESHPIIGFQGTGCTGLPRFRVLDVLGFVQHHTGPFDVLEQFDISVQQPIARNNHRVLLDFLSECRPLVPSYSVMNQHGQVRCESGRLFLPVVHHGSGADKQDRFLAVGVPIALNQGQSLNGFPQPHVICKAGSHSPPAKESKPREAPDLVRAKCPGEKLMRSKFLKRCFRPPVD